MTNTPAQDTGFNLSLEGEKVRNAKFYFTDQCTVESLNSFHRKAWTQVKEGVVKPDNNFDIELLD